jgi:hypothetical protein
MRVGNGIGSNNGGVKGVPPSIVSKKARQTAKHLFLIYCL